MCRPVGRMVLIVTLICSVGSAAETTMVVCAPGYPGSTAEAQPAMEGFAMAVTTAAGWDRDVFGAEYFESEADGVQRFSAGDAGLGLVTLPFFLEHSDELGLRPEMLAVPTGRQPEEAWSLVAAKGAIKQPSDLDGWRLISLAGHSERFVRGAVLGDWGELPSSMEITFSGAVLSSLRKAARGEKIVVLLDAEQTDALDRLPFAGDLEIVHQSPPLPVSVVCSIGDRVSSEQKVELLGALAGIDERTDAAEALAGVRLDRFEPLNAVAMERVTAAFAGVAE